MKKILFYCQHVLGIGHLIRSLEIVRGLRDFEVCFLNGGETIPGIDAASCVEVVNLPPLKMDEQFTQISVTDEATSLAAIKNARRQRILAEFDRFRPDAVIIELFPFGRKKFAAELLPLLARVKLAGGSTKVVCSLRDILVGRSDQSRYDEWVCAIMNRYFDVLLIHADPRFQRLEESFSQVAQLTAKIHYTGYIAQPPTSGAAAEPEISLGDPTTPLILVSVGGGRVGYELLESAVEASKLLEATLPHRLLVFTGPYIPDERFAALTRLTGERRHIVLSKYTARFLAYMGKADLSLSMAGYNTCMNLLTTKVRALVLPFNGGGDDEQTVRANKLAGLGAVDVIRPDELQPHRLAEKIVRGLGSTPPRAVLELRGAKTTARMLSDLLENGEPRATRPLPSFGVRQDSFAALDARLKTGLDRLQAKDEEIHVFLRDDDVDEDEETLRRLLDISVLQGVPVNLEIIPARLTEAAVKLLQAHKRFAPNLVELHQHGWRHVNHETEHKKSEFGVARGFAEQLRDIESGRERLEEAFGDRFYAAFTPPWNRCNQDTLRILDCLRFKVLSRDRGGRAAIGYGFRELSTTLDLFRWKGGATLKPCGEVVCQLIAQMAAGDPVGILLHHKVMDARAMELLDFLLCRLTQFPVVRFHTLQSLLRRIEPHP